MNKALLYTCGALNAVFTLFHVFLGKVIAGYPLAAGYIAFLQALNLGGILMVAFLAFVFFACQRDMDTRLGRSVLVLAAILYLTRAAGEYIFFPHARPVIVAVCVVAGLLHLAALLTQRSASSAQPSLA